MEDSQAAVGEVGLGQFLMKQCENGEHMQISVAENREKEWQEAKQNGGKLIVQPRRKVLWLSSMKPVIRLQYAAEVFLYRAGEWWE